MLFLRFVIILADPGGRPLFEPVVENFTYREYPIGHTVAPEETRDVAQWLTARIDD